MSKQLRVDKTGYDLKPHGTPEFPYKSSQVKISGYEGKRFIFHWHTEPELTLIVSGHMTYQVNNEIFELRSGDGIYVNSRALHSGWLEGEGDCVYIPLTFQPSLLYSENGSAIEKKYVLPITGDENFYALFLNRDDQAQSKILSLVRECYDLFDAKADLYELEIKCRICMIWSLLWREYLGSVENRMQISDTVRRTEYVRQAVTYIRCHYADKITLDNIADSCGLCRATLCRYFKSVMRQTPFEFLMLYRIRESLHYLMDADLTVTEVATRCGFSGPSYYAELFRRYMKCSPSEYIKRKVL